MSFDTTSIDPGTTPSVAVATDTIAAAKYQRIKLADPNADQTGAYGIDANPMRVRPRRRGTSDYDSGNVAISGTLAAPAAVTTATVNPEGGYIVNPTDTAIEVLLTDTAGNAFFNELVPPKKTVSVPVKDCGSLVGIKAGASVAGARLQIGGTQ